EVAEHHAETVIQRNGNTDAIAPGEALRFADEKTVVEEIVVGQRRTFRRAGRAARELNVDGVVELQLCRARPQPVDTAAIPERSHIVERQDARCGAPSNLDDGAQLR